jgi:DNA polymerase V
MTDLEILRDFVARYATKKSAAQALGVSPVVLSQYLHGVYNIGPGLREKLRAFGYYEGERKDVWQGLKNRPELIKTIDPEPNKIVPLLLSPAHCGTPTFAFGDMAEGVNISKQYNENTFLVRATGESMVTARIQEGDLLLVDVSIAPKQNSIVIVRIGDELCVKRYHNNGGVALLHPDNNRHKPIPISDDVTIVGVVTKVEFRV